MASTEGRTGAMASPSWWLKSCQFQEASIDPRQSVAIYPGIVSWFYNSEHLKVLEDQDPFIVQRLPGKRHGARELL